MKNHFIISNSILIVLGLIISAHATFVQHDGLSKKSGYPAFSVRGGGDDGSTTTKPVEPEEESLEDLVQELVDSNRKLVVVTGGVLSGIGKGVTASSIGVLFRAMGYRVTALKIDP